MIKTPSDRFILQKTTQRLIFRPSEKIVYQLLGARSGRGERVSRGQVAAAEMTGEVAGGDSASSPAPSHGDGGGTDPSLHASPATHPKQNADSSEMSRTWSGEGKQHEAPGGGGVDEPEMTISVTYGKPIPKPRSPVRRVVRVHVYDLLEKECRTEIMGVRAARREPPRPSPSSPRRPFRLASVLRRMPAAPTARALHVCVWYLPHRSRPAPLRPCCVVRARARPRGRQPAISARTSSRSTTARCG